MESIAKILVFSLALAGSSAMPTGKFGMPASCSNSDYCTEKHELYPQELVERLLQTANMTFASGTPSLVDRVDDGTDERDCQVDATNDPIYEIMDAEGNVRVVLQSESGFRQTVAIERCQRPGHVDYQTRHFSLEAVSEFNLHCVERKLDLSFLVITTDWEGFEMVKTKTGIPVACVCQFFEK